MAKSLVTAALAAAGLVMLTGAVAVTQRLAKVEEAPRPAIRSSADAAAAATERCAINHARFGGSRAQMYKVSKDGVANYVVMEVGSKRDPLMRFVRKDWLRVAYGEDAQHVWLGGFGSGDAALARAAELCPPHLRCLPGDAGCAMEARHATPAQVFSGQ
jgi:hypothetical protein